MLLLFAGIAGLLVGIALDNMVVIFFSAVTILSYLAVRSKKG